MDIIKLWVNLFPLNGCMSDKINQLCFTAALPSLVSEFNFWQIHLDARQLEKLLIILLKCVLSKVKDVVYILILKCLFLITQIIHVYSFVMSS